MNKRISFRLAWPIIGLILLTACGMIAQTATEPQIVADRPAETTITEAVNAAPTAESAPEVAATAATAVPAAENPIAQALLDLEAQQAAYIDIYEAVNPSVVNITVGNGEGSGFVYDAQGHIITNNHVVQGAQEALVTFADGRQLPAEIVGLDPDSDLAVIKVNAAPDSLTPVTLADSESLQVGQIVIAIGNPFGLQGSMTTGIISGLDRLLPATQGFSIPDVIQTDAAINPGNSGGPLLDLYGQVIGVTSAIESPVRGSSGIGYAIPANIVNSIVPQLIAGGTADYPWIGIAGGGITPALANQLGIDEAQQGIFVSNVIQGGPAAAAGLRANQDIIVGVDGQTVTEIDDLLAYLVQHTTVGQTINLAVLRGDDVINLAVTLQARP